MKSVKTITTTAAFVLVLSGYASAQGTLGDGGTSGAAHGSAVESAPSAVEAAPSAVQSSKGAVESSPTSGSGFGSSSGGSTDSSITTPNGNTFVVKPSVDINGNATPANSNGR
jgi:hypothetical protein